MLSSEFRVPSSEVPQVLRPRSPGATEAAAVPRAPETFELGTRNSEPGALP